MTEFQKQAEILCLQANIRPYCYSIGMETSAAFSQKPLGAAIAMLLEESKECEKFPTIDAKFIRAICYNYKKKYKVVKNGKKFTLEIHGTSIDIKQWNNIKAILWD